MAVYGRGRAGATALALPKEGWREDRLGPVSIAGPYIAAIHEAGHAVVAYQLGIIPETVAATDIYGHVRHGPEKLTAAIPTIAAAGREAERLFGIEQGHGFRRDRATIRASAAVLARREGHGRPVDYVVAAVLSARTLCRLNRDAIDAVARQLMTAGRLDGPELAALLEAACRRR